MFSLSNLMIAAIVGALVYYGWPIIEAILLLLPIPDPKEVQEKLQGWTGSALSAVTKGVASGKQEMQQYSSSFNAPSTLNLSDDDDDEEDIGKKKEKAKANEFDSDDNDDESGDTAQTELISLDSKPTKKRVPKLKKPETK